MSHPTRLALAAAAAVALAVPAAAQDADMAYDVAFFERVTVGELDVTPFGIVRDTRCADERFCFREDTLIVSVMLHDRRVPYEVVLELNRYAPVPGGWLVLRDAGTLPVERGALHLREYALDIEFVPLDRVDFR